MKKLLCFCVLTLCFGLVTTSNGQDLLTHDFNDGTLGPLESTNLNRMTFRDGTLECTWKPSDYTGTGTSSKKTEFRADDNGYEFRQEFWTGFNVKVHDDVFEINTNNDMSFMQIWGFDETGANHYAMLKFDGRNGGALTWYHRNGGGSAGKANFLVYPNFPRNRFVDIIIHVKLSSNGGIVQIWADGVLKLDISGQNMGWGEMNANGQINNSYSTPGSWGMYNYRNVGGYEQTYDSNSHYFDGYLDGETRTVTYDNLTLWNGSNGYDIVNPADNCGGFDAFSVIEAEDYCEHEGIQTVNANSIVGYVNDGDWLKYEGVNFGNGANSVSALVSSGNIGGNIEIRQGSITGNLLGILEVENTGSWTTWETVSTNVSSVNGEQDIYLVFSGGDGYLLDVDNFQFSNETLSTNTATYIEQATEVVIYPNPISSKATLKNAENSNLRIYDMNGRVVFTKFISSEKEDVNLSELSTGIYYAEIANNLRKSVIKIIRN